MRYKHLGYGNYLFTHDNYAILINDMRSTADVGVDLETKESLTPKKISEILEFIDDENIDISELEEMELRKVLTDITIRHPETKYIVQSEDDVDLARKGLEESGKQQPGGFKGFLGKMFWNLYYGENADRKRKEKKELQKFLTENKDKMKKIEKELAENEYLLDFLESTLKHDQIKPADIAIFTELVKRGDFDSLKNMNIDDFDKSMRDGKSILSIKLKYLEEIKNSWEEPSDKLSDKIAGLLKIDKRGILVSADEEKEGDRWVTLQSKSLSDLLKIISERDIPTEDYNIEY
jgi:hypothetical protein